MKKIIIAALLLSMASCGITKKSTHMNVIATSLKKVAFQWNIANGDNGAIGLYTTPIELPSTAVVKYVTVNVISLMGPAGARIALGWTGNTGYVSFIMAPVSLSSLVFEVQGGDPITKWGVAATDTPAQSGAVNPFIQLQISGATITQGNFIFYIEYY